MSHLFGLKPGPTRLFLRFSNGVDGWTPLVEGRRGESGKFDGRASQEGDLFFLQIKEISPPSNGQP